MARLIDCPDAAGDSTKPAHEHAYGKLWVEKPIDVRRFAKGAPALRYASRAR
jgi:hypothetical protein